MLDIVLLDTDEGELRHRLPVCVIDSRPIILDGDMRHRIRLHGGTPADWPGADVSSCQGQTSRREEAGPGIQRFGLYSLQVTRFKAVRRHSRHRAAQLVRSLLISGAASNSHHRKFKEFADKRWRHCRAPARAVPVPFNRPAHGE